jgi:hypothetical protein
LFSSIKPHDVHRVVKRLPVENYFIEKNQPFKYLLTVHFNKITRTCSSMKSLSKESEKSILCCSYNSN